MTLKIYLDIHTGRKGNGEMQANGNSPICQLGRHGKDGLTTCFCAVQPYNFSIEPHFVRAAALPKVIEQEKGWYRHRPKWGS